MGKLQTPPDAKVKGTKKIRKAGIKAPSVRIAKACKPSMG